MRRIAAVALATICVFGALNGNAFAQENPVPDEYDVGTKAHQLGFDGLQFPVPFMDRGV